MFANILSHSCPFCYVSFLRTKWLYYYLSMSEMLHTKQNKRNWGWKFKRHLEKSTQNTLYSLNTCKDNFFTFYWKSCKFTEPNVRAEIMSYGLEKSVICAILQKTIMIMSLQFCQLLCKYIKEIPSSVRISLSIFFSFIMFDPEVHTLMLRVKSNICLAAWTNYQ